MVRIQIFTGINIEHLWCSQENNIDIFLVIPITNKKYNKNKIHSRNTQKINDRYFL